MKKLLILGAFLGLFGTSNAFAAEVETVNQPVEQTEVALAADHVDYWVTNVWQETDMGKTYLHFTVNWEYTGSLSSPQIAFDVHIYEGQYERYYFMDSAIGISSGSRDYKKEVYDRGDYSVIVKGSNGGWD